MRNVYLILLLSCISAFAQNENNHWQLGPLDFNFSTNPNTVTTISGITDINEYGGNHNYSTISDENGNLKFYFDGKATYDSAHNFMAGVTVVPDESFDYQGSIILPQPGNSSMYYVFYNHEYATLGTDDGSPSRSFYGFTRIDFSGSSGVDAGQGSFVDSQGVWSESLYNPGDFKPMTFTRNAANDGYWIIVQIQNKLYSYLLNVNGLSAPVITTFTNDKIYHTWTDSFFNTYYSFKGMFRVIPDYSNPSAMKLYGIESGSYFYTLDFNKSTGQFTNFQQLSLDQTGVYNFEMSNDNEKLYFVQGSGEDYYTSAVGGKIYVKDLSAISTPSRLLYDYNTPTQASIDYSFIQKDKYGNLLIGSKHTSNNKHQYVHKIMNPDSFLTSSVKQNYLYLNGKAIVSFPQLIPILNNCADYLTLTATNNVTSGTDLRKAEYAITASNIISNGATAIYHAGQAVILKSGFRSISGSSFRAYIEGCDSGAHFRVGQFEETEGVSEELSSLKGLKLFVLSPNPASETVLISSTAAIQNITVTSFDGKVIFNKNLNGKDNRFELYVRDYIDGFYTITVTTTDGKTETQKLIKD